MKVLERYNLGKIIRCKKIVQGVANHNWLIFTDKCKFILRKVPSFKSKKDIEFEFRYINHFRGKFPYTIPMPLRNNDGQLITGFNGRFYWVYRFIEGEVINSI